MGERDTVQERVLKIWRIKKLEETKEKAHSSPFNYFEPDFIVLIDTCTRSPARNSSIRTYRVRLIGLWPRFLFAH